MARAVTPEQAQRSTLGPVFRRVNQTTSPTASSIYTDSSVTERVDGLVGQDVPLPIPSQQSLDSLTNSNAGTQEEPEELSRLIIAVDFGTTYSSVSYTKVNPGVDSTRLPLNKISCIDNYGHADGTPEARANLRLDNVPTKLLFRKIHFEGSDASDQSDDASLPNDARGNGSAEPTSSSDRRAGRPKKRGKRLYIPTAKRRPSMTPSPPRGWTIHWGFSVQHKQRNPHRLASYPEKKVVQLMKLMLGEDPTGDEDLRNKRAELDRQIAELQSEDIIHDRDHLLYHYLFRLMRHTKAVLESKGLLEAARPEFVLCVPVSWSEKACRTMHDVMAKALQASSLATFTRGVIPDLFIVSEPEAAAQYAVAHLGDKGRLNKGEVFIILDAGGGTVDITTYEVKSEGAGPLRLKGEAVAPDGALCGSSLITERFLRKLRVKLAEVEPGGDPKLLDEVATSLANHWDLYDKGKIDITHKDKWKLRGIYHNGRQIKWTEAEVREIFEPSLKGTADLLMRQLQLAKEKNLIVNKLIVVGGFGESPSLKHRLKQVRDEYCEDSGLRIEDIWPEAFPTSAVARGAVLRAFDKRNGPDRYSRSSFGFLRHERYGTPESPEHPEHNEANVVPTRDDIDHVAYVQDTIYWLIHAGDLLPSRYWTKPILSYHTFEPNAVSLICVEKLYTSQVKHRSHFQREYIENRGAFELSHIEIDVSNMRKEFPLIDRPGAGRRLKLSNRQVRLVEFDLVIVVEGKQLKFEARWPPGTKTSEEVRIRKSGYVSLAPTFAPGTA